MDEIDEAIVELLELDGRLTHREVASAVGLSRSAAAARVQRLLDSGQVVIRGAVHPAVLGRGSLAHVSVVVHGSAAVVAEHLAHRDDVPFLSLTSGLHGLIAEVRAASARDVEQAVAEIRALRGVSGVDTLSYVEVIRDVIGPVGEVATSVDATDRALLDALQRDGRAAYVELAEIVGLSPAGARRRVVRLIESNVVRVGAVVRHSGADRQSALGLGVRLAGARADVIEHIASMPQVIFAARTLGRFDLLVTVRAFSPGQLVEVLDRVRELPGVNAVESWTHLDVVKESYAASFD